MNLIIRQSVTALSAVLMACLAVVTILMMVVAPDCTGIMQKADAYKIVSLCVFVGAYYTLAWRRRSVVASLLIPTVEIAAGLLFAYYINSLPLSCPL